MNNNRLDRNKYIDRHKIDESYYLENNTIEIDSVRIDYQHLRESLYPLYTKTTSDSNKRTYNYKNFNIDKKEDMIDILCFITLRDESNNIILRKTLSRPLLLVPSLNK